MWVEIIQACKYQEEGISWSHLGGWQPHSVTDYAQTQFQKLFSDYAPDWLSWFYTPTSCTRQSKTYKFYFPQILWKNGTFGFLSIKFYLIIFIFLLIISVFLEKFSSWYSSWIIHSLFVSFLLFRLFFGIKIQQSL